PLRTGAGRLNIRCRMAPTPSAREEPIPHPAIEPDVEMRGGEQRETIHERTIGQSRPSGQVTISRKRQRSAFGDKLAAGAGRNAISRPVMIRITDEMITRLANNERPDSDSPPSAQPRKTATMGFT